VAFALHALLSEADELGFATLDRMAIRFRDDYLESLRARGLDANAEAGRLSLDEVRGFLTSSVLPRLTGQGFLQYPVGSPGDPRTGVRVSPALWAEIRGSRAVLAEDLRLTGEHAAVAAAAPTAPPATGGSVLEAHGLVKIYKRRRVVDDVAVRLTQGEIVGLLGPNGAGKTTTFYMIVGLIDPFAGRILFDGDDITRMPMYRRARRGIGYLSQEPSIFRKLTVEENILAILETLPLSKVERRARLESLLGELNIKHLRDHKAFSLSGGERRRL
jgi:lipopolysaccharide export system ATP-binding protein